MSSPPSEVFSSEESSSSSVVASQSNEVHSSPSSPPLESKKLIVNYLPVKMNTNNLKQLFSRYGSCTVSLIRDPVTRSSLCYAFVDYKSLASAKQAIQNLNGVSFGNKTLKVDFARPRDRTRVSSNLFVIHLPRNLSLESFRSVFEPFGQVLHSKLLFHKKTGQKKGSGFIRFAESQSARAAINALNNTNPFNGAQPIQIKYAEPPIVRIRRKHLTAKQIQNNTPQHPIHPPPVYYEHERSQFEKSPRPSQHVLLGHSKPNYPSYNPYQPHQESYHSSVSSKSEYQPGGIISYDPHALYLHHATAPHIRHNYVANAPQIHPPSHSSMSDPSLSRSNESPSSSSSSIENSPLSSVPLQDPLPPSFSTHSPSNPYVQYSYIDSPQLPFHPYFAQYPVASHSGPPATSHQRQIPYIHPHHPGANHPVQNMQIQASSSAYPVEPPSSSQDYKNEYSPPSQPSMPIRPINKTIDPKSPYQTDNNDSNRPSSS